MWAGLRRQAALDGRRLAQIELDRRALFHSGRRPEAGGAGFPDGTTACIGIPVAEQYFGFDGHPTELYLRSVSGPNIAQQISRSPWD